MRPKRSFQSQLVLCGLLMLASVAPATAAELMITQITEPGFDVDRVNKRLVLSALGRLWTLPLAGGTAEPLTPWGLVLQQPRVSPDGRQVIASGGWQRHQQHLWLIDLESGAWRQLTDGAWRDHSASWHPDSRQIVFVSDRSGNDDIWQQPLERVDAVRLTRHPGQETDPIYSNNGASIVYIGRDGDDYLLQRQFFQGRATTLHRSQRPLSAPTIRRGGILITFFEALADESQALNVLLPVQEMLVKTLARSRFFSRQPLVWLDRDHYLIAENGYLQRYELATSQPSAVPITLWVSVPEPSADSQPVAMSHAVKSRFVLRAERVYDVAGGNHWLKHDVAIENGRITRIVPRRNWSQEIVIDLGDATVLPGLIDAESRSQPEDARRWLAAGVTTIASIGGETADASLTQPAPRRLSVGQYLDLRGIDDNRERLAQLEAAPEQAIITDQLLPDVVYRPGLLDGVAETRQASISRYADQQLIMHRSQSQLLSKLAANGRLASRSLATLMQSRLWPPGQQFARQPVLPDDSRIDYGHLLVAASGQSPLPAGLSLQTELIIMQQLSVRPADIIDSATRRAAKTLGLADIGEIREGFVADLVVVDGDPLKDVSNLLKTIAVVREGEFLSVAQLLE